MQRLELGLADRETGPVPERHMIVAPAVSPFIPPVRAAFVRQVEPRPEAFGELPRPRQEVGVYVCLRDRDDAKLLARRQIDVAVDVALGIENDRVPGTLAPDQVRVLRERIVENLSKEHSVEAASRSPSSGAATATAR